MKKIFCLLALVMILAGCNKIEDPKRGMASSFDKEKIDQSSIKPLSDGFFELIPEESEVVWKFTKLGGFGGHTGLVAVEGGSLIINNDNITGEVLLNMEKLAVLDLKNNNEITKLLSKMRDDTWLSTSKNPKSNIVILKTENMGKGLYKVFADLTIKGITNPIEFETNFSEIDNKLVGVSKLNIDRTLWNIDYDSGTIFKNLGSEAIDKNLNFEVVLSTSRVE